jgi:hypothetical protein
MNVVVQKEKHDVTIGTIATYGLSSCYFFLLNGNYYDDNITKPFAYLNHHSKWIEPDTDPPIEIVVSFLNIFTRFLKHLSAVDVIHTHHPPQLLQFMFSLFGLSRCDIYLD